MRTLIVTLLLLAGPAYAGQVCGPFGCSEGRTMGERLLNHPLLDRRDDDYEPRARIPETVECRTKRCEFYESCAFKTVCE